MSQYIENDGASRMDDKRAAYLIRTDGHIEKIEPTNGSDFDLEELQGYVGGWIEIVHTVDGRPMVCHENGRLIRLAPNLIATGLYGRDVIVGNVVVCPQDMVR